MAGFATHAEFRPSGVEGVVSYIEIFQDMSGVAVRTHEVPVLLVSAPMLR